MLSSTPSQVFVSLSSHHICNNYDNFLPLFSFTFSICMVFLKPSVLQVQLQVNKGMIFGPWSRKMVPWFGPSQKMPAGSVRALLSSCTKWWDGWDTTSWHYCDTLDIVFMASFSLKYTISVVWTQSQEKIVQFVTSFNPALSCVWGRKKQNLKIWKFVRCW